MPMMPMMRLTFSLIFLFICCQNCFPENQLTGAIFQNYRVSLEQSSIQASGSNELFISVFKNDLPITKLLLKHEGNLEEFLVMDINKDESLEIILILNNTLNNIRIFSLKGYELVEHINLNQHIDNKKVKFLKIERKEDEIFRKLEVTDDKQTYQLVQRFCFRELQWCDSTN